MNIVALRLSARTQVWNKKKKETDLAVAKHVCTLTNMLHSNSSHIYAVNLVLNPIPDLFPK